MIQVRRFARSAVLLAALLFFTSLPVVAQDAGQVLWLTVGYNTLKNSVKLSPEVSQEVERLGKLAVEATAKANYGEAVKHLFHGIALMRGESWTPERALSYAMQMKLERAMLEPGQPAGLRLSQLFAPDEKPTVPLTATVRLMPLQGNEPLATLRTIENFNADLNAKPALEFTAPDVADGTYRVTLVVQGQAPAAAANGAGISITRTAAIRIERGLASRVAAAKARFEKARAEVERRNAPALAAALPSIEYRIAIYDLANAGEVNLERVDFAAALKEADEMLADIEAGRDPFAARRGDIRKAYRSEIDNTLQPYRIFIPSTYDGKKAMPLIIALHGMGGDENNYFEGYQNGLIKKLAEERGYIVACPKGRDPASMYLGNAERDVMDVLAEVKRAYRIDEDRVYLTGHSMGGFGTWSIAMNHPTVFAALAPVAGGGLPLGMAKIAHIPQLVVHGDADKTVPVERSRAMVEAARKLNAEVKFIEVPGGDHSSVVARTLPDVFDWFDAHRRNAGAKAANQ